MKPMNEMNPGTRLLMLLISHFKTIDRGTDDSQFTQTTENMFLPHGI